MRVELDLWYDAYNGAKIPKIKATLVDVLPAMEAISPDIIHAYYSGPAGEPPPKAVMQRNAVTRNVYLKDSGGYVVLPMTERNIKCVKELDE